MIIPNLLVTDMRRSIEFYRDTLAMTLIMAVSRDREILSDGDCKDGAFVILEWNGGQLMLQTAASLADELPVFDGGEKPTASGTIYFRDLHPNDVLERVSEDQIVKGPTLQWYGMMELYLRDPDGYVICIGTPEGPPPK
ncbi:glyoxalase/bleomycin resistance/extradiol dioxygenase family protein [Pelagibius sp. Alg239-R121]|uniref:VOC family protein n=1 Tax=Pelagibius sp. Alg239-R121 TaxID=2993448 RepID=UPI0024A6714B|nr:VOC family protein [Pelagibius sp. Alg239-R121]